jgi:hypothetical protein
MAAMSKRTTTRWYTGAWIVSVLVLIAMIMSGRVAPESGSNPSGLLLGYVLLAVLGIVMLVMWIGALIRLGMQRTWGWFMGVLVLHLIGLGIIGMVAYAIAGPEDDTAVVTRPTTPV